MDFSKDATSKTNASQQVAQVSVLDFQAAQHDDNNNLKYSMTVDTDRQSQHSARRSHYADQDHDQLVDMVMNFKNTLVSIKKTYRKAVQDHNEYKKLKEAELAKALQV